MVSELVVLIKNVYGQELIYPACEKSMIFAQIAGDKTLTEKNVNLLKKAGFTFKVKNKKI